MRALFSFPWVLGLCLSAALGFLSRADDAADTTVRWSPAFERQVSRNVDNLQVSATDAAAAADEEKIIIWNPISASLTSGCAGSGCVGSACGLSGCAGSACGLSGCVGSGCGGSVCGGSACAASGCGLSVCLGSACGLSGCIGSACTQSGCVGSLCLVSVCAGSACIVSGCLEGSYCIASMCIGSNCIGSVACGGKCVRDAYALHLEQQMRPVDDELCIAVGGVGWWTEIIEANKRIIPAEPE
jgi:hypothetical protein